MKYIVFMIFTNVLMDAIVKIYKNPKKRRRESAKM